MRYFLTAFFILLGCYLIVNLVGFLEAHKLCISHAVLRPSKTSKNDISRFVKQKGSYAKNVDPSSLSNTKNTKILFISDLHAEFCFIPAAKVIDTIRKANVDAVVFGGDICNDPLKHEVGTSYLFEIKKACDELHIPFLGTTGNHDVHLTKDEVLKSGFTDLRDGPVKVRDIIFSGVNDTGKKDRVWGDVSDIDNEGLTHVLISHNPDWLLDAASKSRLGNVDHMISGHIHGGQICLPFRLEIMVIRKDVLPRKRVINGVFDGAGVTFFIGRGIGCVLVPFRLFARPEITIVEFEK